MIISVYELLGDNRAKSDDDCYKAYVSRKKNHSDGLGTERYAASVVGFDKKRGLLLLKINQGFIDDGTLKLKSASIGEEDINTSTILCSYGFCESKELPQLIGTGKILDMNSHFHYHQTTLKFKELQRGSPVYSRDSSGELVVVGIVSGHEKSTVDRHEVIPIEYADVLIGRVFREQLKAKLAKISSEIPEMQKQLKVLSKQQEWSILEKHNNCQLTIEWNKSFSRFENVAKIKVRIDVDFTDSSGAKRKKYPHLEFILEPSSDGTSFCLDKELKKIDERKHEKAWQSIEGITIQIVPLDKDEIQINDEPERLRPDRYPVPSN